MLTRGGYESEARGPSEGGPGPEARNLSRMWRHPQSPVGGSIGAILIVGIKVV